MAARGLRNPAGHIRQGDSNSAFAFAPASSASIATASTAAGGRTASSAGSPETLRISTAKLDALLLQAEEMLSVKLTATRAPPICGNSRRFGTMGAGMDQDMARGAKGV